MRSRTDGCCPDPWKDHEWPLGAWKGQTCSPWQLGGVLTRGFVGTAGSSWATRTAGRRPLIFAFHWGETTGMEASPLLLRMRVGSNTRDLSHSLLRPAYPSPADTFSDSAILGMPFLFTDSCIWDINSLVQQMYLLKKDESPSGFYVHGLSTQHQVSAEHGSWRRGLEAQSHPWITLIGQGRLGPSCASCTTEWSAHTSLQGSRSETVGACHVPKNTKLFRDSGSYVGGGECEVNKLDGWWVCGKQSLSLWECHKCFIFLRSREAINQGGGRLLS